MSHLEPDSIAIVGLGCRFPGGADTPEKLWGLVYEGRQTWEEVPSNRYNWPAFHHPDPDAKGVHNARGGFFLQQDPASFDARFFGISATEAAAIDPQQRLLLEVSYEALENAGMTVESIRGSQTGVYVALVSRDYDRQSYKDPSQIPKHHLTGCGDATACGRISYVFDLRGPCMSLDTGCSGGMVALHLACQSLRLGEANAAIVGGTNLLLGPDMTIAMSALRMVNDNGRCYPFDSRGAGYGRAEGVAAIVLKRLTDAVRDGDPIRAVIRNTGVNQDGKTNGILLPSSEAQEQLATSLYRQAGLNPANVCYVEAHGTGTQAGDVAEVNSIKQTFVNTVTDRQYPLFLGSIKANLGHSESTSGLAGVIKTVMALEKAIIPPVAALETIKPTLHDLLESKDIIIPRKPLPWPHEGPRLASVNSFGFGGTNAHAIIESSPLSLASGVTGNGLHEALEDPQICNGYSDSSSCVSASSTRKGLLTPSENSDDDPVEKSPVSPADEENPRLFVISARSKISLENTIYNIQQWAMENGATDAKRRELATTLSLRRSRFNWRSTVVASSYSDLLAALNKPRLTKSAPSPRLVFLFTGQGAQYHGMGRQLLQLSTAFARSVHQSQEILTELGANWRLVDELLCDVSQSRINSAELSQPATTAIQIALVDLLEEQNIRPSIVLGHSSGEVAAAYAAGILSHREAILISYHKGFVAGWCKEAVTAKGAMMAVGLGEAEALEYVRKGSHGRCVVACVNSPSSVTLSGDESAVEEIQALLDKDSIFNRRLRVDIAYHSHHMQAVSDRFKACLHGLTANSPRESVHFISSVTGEEKAEPLNASYWVDNLVSQVRFAPALEHLAQKHFVSSEDGLELVEIGPHAALQGPVRQIMELATGSSSKWSYRPSLIRNKDAHEAALELIGGLFEDGVHVDLAVSLSEEHIQPHSKMPPVAKDLPPYSWDHSNQYWHESRLSKEYRLRQHPPHDLLGLRLTGTSTIEPVFRHILTVDDLPWLQEHIIDGFALYPGSAFLCMAIEALRQVSQDRGETRDISKYIFQDVSFSKALVVPDSPGSIEVLISLQPSRRSKQRLHMVWEEFRVTSVAADGTWNEHCQGFIRAEFRSEVASENTGESERNPAATSPVRGHLETMIHSCQQTIDPKDIYGHMRENGIDYGESFAIIHNLQLGDRQAIGRLHVPDIRRLMPSHHMQPHVIHPAVFDAFMHIALPLYHRHCSEGPVMLVSIGEASVSADILNKPGDELLVACKLTQGGRKHGAVEVSIFQEDAQGSLLEVASLGREEFRGIGEGVASNKNDVDESSCLSNPLSCYQIDWIPPVWSPGSLDHTGNGYERRVSVSCFQETPLTKSVAADLVSHLRKWGIGDCGAVACCPETMDPDALHIVLGDGSILPAGMQTLAPLLSQIKSILLVTMSTGDSVTFPVGSLGGLASVARREADGLLAVTLDYRTDSFAPDSNCSELFELVTDIMSSTFMNAASYDDTVDLEYLYQGGELLVPRLRPTPSVNDWLAARVNGTGVEEVCGFHEVDHALQLHFKTAGLLDSAIFIPGEHMESPLEPDEISVKVYAHAVNQVDVAIAVGRGDPTESMLGEFAGTVVAAGSLAQKTYKVGDHVCGWGSMPYTNIARVRRHMVHRVDSSISFAEAASIPLAFQTAAYALSIVARLEKSQSILIHGAAGAVGQAAISLAQHIGAEIYATVGNSAKRQLLVDEKGIPEDRIYSNTSTIFVDEIQRLTGGKGVDVILNCSSSDLIDDSMSCVSDFGYMIDVTKSKQPVSLNRCRAKNVTFAVIDMRFVAEKRPAQFQELFATVMSLYQQRKLQPVTPIHTLPLPDLSNAFRLIQSQRCLGKMILAADDGVCVKQVSPKPAPLQLSSDGTYLVIGGETALNHALCMFLEDRGARHIRSVMSSPVEGQATASKTSPFETVYINMCSDIEISSAITLKDKANTPPIKGVLYIEDIPETIHLSSIKEEEFQSMVAQLYRRKASIERSARQNSVEFCLTIGSIEALLGLKGRAVYATGSPYVDKISSSNLCNSITLRVGRIALDHVPSSKAQQDDQITLPVMPVADLYMLLEYCLGPAAQRNNSRELFAGFNEAAWPMESLVFRELANSMRETSPCQTGLEISKVDQRIAATRNVDEILQIVVDAAVQQLASFLAIDPEDIQAGKAITDVGLDSLLAIEFKNWVVRTLQAPMQTSEILDAPSLAALAQLIVQRSKLVQKGDLSNTSSEGHGKSAAATQLSSALVPAETPLGPITPPPLPIPELGALISRHLSYLRAFATDEEFENTTRLAADFQAPGSMGQRLYDRLQAIKEGDPENWYHDLYLRNQYLVRNGSLAPYMNFFFTHPLAPSRHNQAERAALIASTVIDYKHRLDMGRVNPQFVNEEPLCLDLYKYLFNASREPSTGVDVMRQYPQNDYFVVFRRGHVYKIDFDPSAGSTQEEKLYNAFTAILGADVNEVDWLGILTADNRISWAKNRQSFMDIAEENVSYIHTIEKSAFVICLDDGEPETPEERGRHFHFGDGSNRWHDKPIEYIIAANGVSGILGDHTGLDARTVHDLNTIIATRIRDHRTPTIRPPRPAVAIEEVTHSALPVDLVTRIEEVRANYENAIASREHRYPPPLPYGSALMKKHNVPINSAFQLLVQLASRFYFGYISPCWETVLQSNFHKGRVEINQVVSAQVASFVEAASEGTVSLATCKQLFIEAARAHSSSVLACTRAGGSDRFLSMLREIVQDDEEEPGLYHDPVYKRARPRKLISNCFTTGMAENGCCLRDDEGIWLHFEVEPQGVRFSILGPTGRTSRFCDSLVKASEIVRSILDA